MRSQLGEKGEGGGARKGIPADQCKFSDQGEIWQWAKGKLVTGLFSLCLSSWTTGKGGTRGRQSRGGGLRGLYPVCSYVEHETGFLEYLCMHVFMMMILRLRGCLGVGLGLWRVGCGVVGMPRALPCLWWICFLGVCVKCSLFTLGVSYLGLKGKFSMRSQLGEKGEGGRCP